MAAELRADRSAAQLARAVTLYHIVVEGSVAQPGQHMLDRAFEQLDMLPAFREGMSNVSTDEQRHIAFGVRLLADLYRADPEPIQEAIVSTINETLPWASTVGYPPGGDRSYTEALGFTLEDLFEEGARMQEARLRSIGLPLDDIVPFPLPLDVTPRERVVRGLRMIEGGYVGDLGRPVSRDPEDLAVVFDSVARSADPRHARPGTTVQWDFVDADPWHVRIDGGRGTPVPGRASDPTLTLRMTLDDFAGVVARRTDPRVLLLRRRIRPRGDLRLLLRMPRLFP
jgi:hypothetical protein